MVFYIRIHRPDEKKCLATLLFLLYYLCFAVSCSLSVFSPYSVGLAVASHHVFTFIRYFTDCCVVVRIPTLRGRGRGEQGADGVMWGGRAVRFTRPPKIAFGLLCLRPMPLYASSFLVGNGHHGWRSLSCLLIL